MLLVACGDAGMGSGTDGVSVSGSTSTATSEDSTSASASAATSEDSGSASASMSLGTDTDPTTSAASESSTTAGTGETSTGEPPAGMCAAPPAGYAGPTDRACVLSPDPGMFTPVVEWEKGSWETEPALRHIISTPIVVSLTDDNADGLIDAEDDPDIVVATWGGNAGYNNAGAVRAMHGKDGADIFTIPSSENLFGSTGLAAGDIDGDGMVEIVAHARDGSVKAYEHTGEFKWQSPALDNPGFPEGGYPAIADLDADGTPEVILGRYILRNDGTIRGTGAHGNAFELSFAADIDLDGLQEVVVGNALYDADGNALWFNDTPDGLPAVADIDQDGNPDIVVASGYYGDTVRLQSGEDGAVVWSTKLPSMGGGPPTIADFDGDGAPEIGVASGMHYVVLEGDGTILWQQSTIDGSSRMTGSSVFDFEGDGAAEVLYNDEQQLRVYMGSNGDVKMMRASPSDTLWEYPLVVDLDGDGQGEIVSTSNNATNNITVLGDADESWRSTRKIWNQHAYNITNVNDDGTIPAVPAPNHETYNSFRSADLSPPDGTDALDLTLAVLDPCVLECADGKLVVQAHVGNEGLSPLTGPATLEVVGLLGGQPVVTLTQEVPAPLATGQYTDAFQFELPAAGIDAVQVTVSAAEAECDVANNTITLEGVVCP